MAELRPLREYLYVEAWQYEDGGFGWSIKAANGGDINKVAMRDILLEMSESSLKTDTILAHYFTEDGHVLARRSKKLKADSKYHYLWSLRKSYVAVCLSAQFEDTLPWYLRLAFLLSFWQSQFKRSLSRWRVRRRATPAPAPARSEEYSEGLEKAVEERGVVVPLRPRGE